METEHTGAFGTKQEVRFTHEVIPVLVGLGVNVRGLRHVEGGSDELHVDLVLPSHDRALRDKVLGLLDSFEESYAFTTTVSPALLYADDLADA